MKINLNPIITRSLSFLALMVCLLITGCDNKKPDVDPCEGLLNESPPFTILVQFVEKASGENLILNNDLSANDITVVDTRTSKPVVNWAVIKRQNSTYPMNGALQFSIFNETPGQYPYTIQLKDQEPVTLMYAVSKVATDNVCKPVAYPVSDISITDKPFTVFINDGKSYPNMLIVEL